jgi:hypothetical protein
MHLHATLYKHPKSHLKSAPPLPQPDIYVSACPPRPAVGLRRQQEKTIDPQPDHSLTLEEDERGLAEPETIPGPTPNPTFAPSEPAVAEPLVPRKRRHRRLMAPGSLLFQTPGSPSL